MILESSYWKLPLARDADLVEAWAAKTAMTGRRSALIERKVMLSAFAIRKLAESKKLSSAFSDRSVGVRAYKAKPDRIDRISFSSQLDRDYEMDSPEEMRVPVMKMLDQIIHSHVFVEATSDTGAIEAFIVSSDRDRVAGVIEVGFPEFLATMRAAANDYPDKVMLARSQTSGKIVYWQGSGDIPKHVKAKFDAARGPAQGD